MTLHALASRLGIATGYTDAWRAPVRVVDATLVAVIAAMGWDTTSAGWVERAHRALDLRDAARHVEPVLVAWDGLLDHAAAFARVEDHASLVITDEDEHDITADIRSGRPIPFGYCRVHLGAHRDAALVVSAPRHLAPPTVPRVFLFAPLYALRPRDTTRATDLRELEELIEWAGAHGASGVLTLPLLASFLDEPLNPSPYAPASRSMWNELYAVLDRGPVDSSASAIDYATWAAATRVALDDEASRLEADPLRAGAFLHYLAEHPEVGAYARFRAAGERFGTDWRAWPAPLRAGAIELADVDPGRVRAHAVAQWLMHEQLTELATRARAKNIILGLDLAVGTHPDAYDVWAHQADYASGCRVGAPPDAFFPGGQGWGFPPPIPERARATGYRDLRAALRHHLGVAGLLRIDHVMGLLRLFWIPDGAAPTDGTYVHAHLDEQLAVICLEAHRTDAIIVGENLGLVPPEIDAALHTHGLLGMTVAYGALDDPDRAMRPLTAPAHDVASLGTHDMATFSGFVHNDDLDDRIALGIGDPRLARAQRDRRTAALDAARATRSVAPADTDALFDAFLSELAVSDAPVLVLSLEDLWGERAPHNVPGTSTERPNWRRRAAFAVSELPLEIGNRVERICFLNTRPKGGGNPTP